MNNQLIEYIKIHKISLEQDLDKPDLKGSEYLDIEAKLDVLSHILEYAIGLDSSRPNMVG